MPHSLRAVTIKMHQNGDFFLAISFGRTRNSDSHASIRMSLIIHEITPRVRRHVIRLLARRPTRRCRPTCDMAEITICQRCWKKNERSLETTAV